MRKVSNACRASHLTRSRRIATSRRVNRLTCRRACKIWIHAAPHCFTLLLLWNYLPRFFDTYRATVFWIDFHALLRYLCRLGRLAAFACCCAVRRLVVRRNLRGQRRRRGSVGPVHSGAAGSRRCVSIALSVQNVVLRLNGRMTAMGRRRPVMAIGLPSSING